MTVCQDLHILGPFLGHAYEYRSQQLQNDGNHQKGCDLESFMTRRG